MRSSWIQASLAGSEYLSDGIEFLVVGALQGDDGLQLLDLFLRKTVLTQFLIDILKSDFIELVYGDGDIDNLIGSPDDFGNSRQNLAVVDLMSKESEPTMSPSNCQNSR